MKLNTTNTRFKLAFDFADKTDVSIFLTGKAGTGKTTLLHHLKQHTRKKIAVCAPTGIAAMHAGGTTLHSLLHLPIQPYASTKKHLFSPERVMSKPALLQNLRMNKDKMELLRELELLVIDEISMVRSDLFEAASDVLKMVRRNPKPFGGLQLLLLGDLFQLPPVVIDDEHEILNELYSGIYFFNAPAYQELNPVFLELNQIYRQSDEQFIGLLNAIRTNSLTPENIALLDAMNQGYQPQENAITLTTHNRTADELNKAALNQLAGTTVTYDATFKGDFSEKAYPTDAVLQLKKNAKVMFVKNDTGMEKRYYNGMLATVEELNDDHIIVRTFDTQDLIRLEKNNWSNIRYKLNKESGEIEEEELGRFSQFPIRLAWAITIHKSQGLTFDQVNIDAASAFASGQVYVALSRCRSLEGIRLLSKINPNEIKVDERIIQFHQQTINEDELTQKLNTSSYQYSVSKLFTAFKLNNLPNLFGQFIEAWNDTLAQKHIQGLELLNGLMEQANTLHQTGEKFTQQLDELLRQNNQSFLFERVTKAKIYFSTNMYTQFIQPIEEFQTKLQKVKRVKQLTADVNLLLNEVWKTLNNVQYISLGEHELPIDYIKREENAKSKIQKPEKGATFFESLKLYQAGKSIAEIAEQRGLATSTIETHLAKFVKSGEVNVYDFISVAELDEVQKAAEQVGFGLNKLSQSLQGKYTFSKLKMAVSFLSPEQQEVSEK